MKNLWLHGVYLAVIGVLGFQLWAKTASTKRVFEQMDKVLTTNCEIIKGTSENIFYQIEKNYHTNTKLFEQTFSNAKAVKNATKSADKVLSNELSNLKDGKPNLNKIKDSLNLFFYQLISTTNRLDSIEFSKKSFVLKLLQNNIFWLDFSMEEAANITLLKNAVRIDELFFHNYFLDKTSNETVIRDYGHRLVIAPRKSSLFKGDKFEGDIYLTTYLIDKANDNLIFSVNGKILPIEDGLVHYKSTENTVGIKLLKMQALIHNPATGEHTTISEDYKYHVLPKCSQNCQ